MKKSLIIFSILALIIPTYFYLKPSVKTSYHFYHWTSTYSVNANETRPPKYIKVLDISFRKNLEFRKTSFKREILHEIVPVIYIDNPLWKKMRAKTMVSKVLNALKTMPLNNYREIQVDCDWTDSSKESYFIFLKELKKQSSKKISVTIRLHQVKYHHKTGIPPVDYGVLMYYNMSDFKNLETKNYILDLDLAKQYHYNFDTYPLPLNLALPLYSQATVIRFSKVVGLIEGVREEELSSKFKKLKEHLYEVQETHYFKERLFYEGDKIRVDEVSVKMLKQSVQELKKVMEQPQEVIFYRWGNYKYYKNKNLESIFSF